MRSYIKQHIIKSWKRCIANDYKKQRINSERSLQAALWHHIYYNLKPHMRLFIEPTLIMESGKKVRPDIIICNSRNIISIMEIKYLPRAKPIYKNDINKLAAVAESGQSGHAISIANNRFLGINKDNTQYKLPKTVLYVWVGIHADKEGGSYHLFSEEQQALKRCYLQLQALTQPGRNPKILINGQK